MECNLRWRWWLRCLGVWDFQEVSFQGHRQYTTHLSKDGVGSRRRNGSLERFKNCPARCWILGMVLRHGSPLARVIWMILANFGSGWVTWTSSARHRVWFELAGDELIRNVLGDWAWRWTRVVFEGVLRQERCVPYLVWLGLVSLLERCVLYSVWIGLNGLWKLIFSAFVPNFYTACFTHCCAELWKQIVLGVFCARF